MKWICESVSVIAAQAELYLTVEGGLLQPSSHVVQSLGAKGKGDS